MTFTLRDRRVPFPGRNPRPQSSQQHPVLSDEEIRKLLDSAFCNSAQSGAAVHLGLRINEIQRVKISDLDLLEKRATVVAKPRHLELSKK